MQQWAIDFHQHTAKKISGGKINPALTVLDLGQRSARGGGKLRQREFRNRGTLQALVAVAGLGAALSSGCGTSVGPQAVNAVITADCPDATGAKITAADVVLLEWSGGVTKIYPGDVLPEIDFAAFETSDGGTLAGSAEAFKEAVRTEVTRILCEMPTDGIHVTNSKSVLPRDHTRVVFAKIASPLGGSQIGQGEYDPCNELHDNDAIIFGEEMLKLGGPYSFDEWVQMFANVTAHEIGHMLGYPHVPRVLYPASQRPAYIELMLATHTVDEMLNSQRYQSDIDNCPADSGVAKAIEVAVYSCGRGN